MTPFAKYNFFKLSFIDDNLESVLANFKRYLMQADDKLVINRKNEIDFELILGKSESDRDEFKFMLFEPLTNEGTTIFFSSFDDGWYAAVYNYSRIFKTEIYQIGITVDHKQQTYPAYFFYNFRYNKSGELEERAVQLIKEENKWTFYENSDKVDPLAVENTQNYFQKRKSDRLNTEIILDYMTKAGYDLKHADFFKTNKPVYYCKWH